MQRGVISLTLSEMNELSKLFPISQKDTHLYQKISNSLQAAIEPAQVQVSEEEVEIMLDNIGIPMGEEISTLQSLRGKIQLFLNQLRSE